jgi:ligand-binding sensor domain-containing protein
MSSVYKQFIFRTIEKISNNMSKRSHCLLKWITLQFTFIVALSAILPCSLVKADDLYNGFENPFVDSVIGAVSSIIQDHYGYLWFGTSYNLIRYDGTGFVIYQYSSSDINSIPGLYTTAICETEDGSIWVGTESGLGKFNRIDGTFQCYTNDPDNPQSLSNNSVNEVIEDKDGTLWVGTLNGLNNLDIELGTFTCYYNDPDDPDSISNDNISTIFIDLDGILWIGTENGLNRFNKVEGTFSRYYILDSNQNSIGINTICETVDGILWIGADNGLYCFDENSGSFISTPILSSRFNSYDNVSVNVI